MGRGNSGQCWVSGRLGGWPVAGWGQEREASGGLGSLAAGLLCAGVSLSRGRGCWVPGTVVAVLWSTEPIQSSAWPSRVSHLLSHFVIMGCFLVSLKSPETSITQQGKYYFGF